MPGTNPYAPPVVSASASAKCDGKDASWYLNRVQKYYRRMGTAMLAYIGIVVVVAVAKKTTDGSLRVADIAGPLLWCAFLAWLFVAMVRIGYMSHVDFPAHYKKARWIGIIEILLKLTRRANNVGHQPTDCCIPEVRIRGDNQLDFGPLECFEQRMQVKQASSQPIKAVDDDSVDLTRLDRSQQPLQFRSIERFARLAFVRKNLCDAPSPPGRQVATDRNLGFA